MRIFTNEEDQAIMAHVRGDYTLRGLMGKLKMARKTLNARAAELGVELRPDPHMSSLVNKRRAAEAWAAKMNIIRDDDGLEYTCSVGKEDKLLAALLKGKR